MAKKELKIKIDKSENEFGEGCTIWINGRWILDASCFSKDFKITIDNHRCKKINHSIGKYGKDVYRFDKRFTR